MSFKTIYCFVFNICLAVHVPEKYCYALYMFNKSQSKKRYTSVYIYTHTHKKVHSIHRFCWWNQKCIMYQLNKKIKEVWKFLERTKLLKKTPKTPLPNKQKTPHKTRRYSYLRFWSICIICSLIMGKTSFPPRPHAILSSALSPAAALLNISYRNISGLVSSKKQAVRQGTEVSFPAVLVFKLLPSEHMSLHK